MAPDPATSAENLLEQLTDRMPDEDVALLDARRRCRRNAEAYIAQLTHLAAVRTGEAHHLHALAARGLDRPHDVAAVAAGRDGQEHVAFAPVGSDLAREDLVVPVVVADRGQRRRVAVKGERRQRLPVAKKPSRQFRRDVLAGGRRPHARWSNSPNSLRSPTSKARFMS